MLADRYSGQIAELETTISAQHPATTHRRAYLASKRVFDVVFAIVVLGVFSPIWIAASILVALSSPGPILYRQTRVGKNGRLFTCLKFRTMVCGADDQKVYLVHLNEVTGPVFKIKRDPRTTGVGRLLRTSSVDELPQLLNVIRGDMSMVGPRPPHRRGGTVHHVSPRAIGGDTGDHLPLAGVGSQPYRLRHMGRT